MKKLEKLLYRKATLERLMNIWSKGIVLYNKYIDACKAVMADSNRTKLERAEAEKNMHEADIPLKHYITSFKLAKRDYEHYVIPEIEGLASERQKEEEIEFEDLNKKAEELAQLEVFGYKKRPDNVELVDINNDLAHHIKLLKTLIEESNKKLQAEEDSYEKAKLEMAIYKYNLHLITAQKRLDERQEYYIKQFKPKYDKDMEECAIYLDQLLERAKQYVELEIDIKLPFLLQEYEKNKADKEKTWLFYTALKSRLRKIAKEMRKHPDKFKKHMHLSKDII